MAAPTDMQVIALHRYFLQANQMRERYYDRLRTEHAAPVDSDSWIPQMIDLSLWYGCLYVVCEGWLQLGMADRAIDGLLRSSSGQDHPNLARLRRFRNFVFHYQREYWDDRFVALLAEGADSAAWARQLNLEFGRHFLEWLRATSR